jgi:hypothetical protein
MILEDDVELKQTKAKQYQNWTLGVPTTSDMIFLHTKMPRSTIIKHGLLKDYKKGEAVNQYTMYVLLVVGHSR